MQATTKTSKTNDYAYLDREDFRSHYAHPSRRSLLYYIVDNVHCSACLQRIESLGSEVRGIEHIRLDMSRNLLEVETGPEGSQAELASRLHAMGYTPHPVAHAALGDDTGRAARKSMLIKVGVAGACAGNIMLLSTSLYAGADRSSYAGLFEWLSFVLFLPVLFYSAIPFYANSLAALRARRASIDLPIAGAVIIGTVVGFYHLVLGRGDVYFDSLAVLVFLLLASRVLLSSLQSRYLAPGHLRAFYEPTRVRVVDAATGDIVERHITSLVTGDEIVVAQGERLPADGVLESAETYVNAAVLTGEATPQRVLRGESVFAGTELVSNDTRIRVGAIGGDTRIGKLLEETERGVMSRTPLISLTDRVAQWFSASVLGLGVVFALLYATVDVQEALNRALALVILACPCALALATPLTQSLALKAAARRGCLIKKAESFEKLCHVRSAFFDKTGTLTRGELELEGWWPGPPGALESSIVRSLELDSPHPIARMLVRALEDTGEVEIQGCRETAGTGVEGTYDGDRYEVRSLRDEADIESSGLGDGAYSFAAVYKNGVFTRVAFFGDAVRESSRAVVEAFGRRGVTPHLVTGDAAGPAYATAKAVGIADTNVMHSVSPEEKQAIIRGQERALMVGDGVNDSVALANAYVSVAVHGSMETSFKAADIYLTEPGLAPLGDLYRLSLASIRTIKHTLLFSLVYNVTFGALALLGHVSPLVAAILMPASSVTVVLRSVIASRLWGRPRATTPARPGATVAPQAAGGFAHGGGRA